MNHVKNRRRVRDTTVSNEVCPGGLAPLASLSADHLKGQRFRHWTDIVAGAIEGGRLMLLRQAVVPVVPGADPLYSECLVRLVGRHGSLIPPGSFIPHLEVEGSITMLDEAVLDQTLAILEQRPEMALGCNVSARSFDTPGQWHRLLRLITLRPELAQRLVLEITESCPLRDPKATQQYIDQARSLGVRVALDDFGAAFATETLLAALDVDIVKIDAAYIERPDALARLVKVASRTTSCIVVEGVEAEHHRIAAIEAGASHVQGRHVAREVACP